MRLRECITRTGRLLCIVLQTIWLLVVLGCKKFKGLMSKCCSFFSRMSRASDSQACRFMENDEQRSYAEELKKLLNKAIDDKAKIENDVKLLTDKISEQDKIISSLQGQDIANRARGKYNVVGETDQRMKLSECFENVFEEEWRDAMRTLFKEKELAGIRFLSRILQECHTYCLKVARDQLARFVYPHHTELKVPEIEQILRKEELRELLKIRETMDQNTSVKLVVARSFWATKSKEFREILGASYEDSDRWKTVEDDNAQGDLENNSHNKSLTAYVRRCCDLCWQAVVMDPPVLLEFDVVGQKFMQISDRYQEYSPLEQLDKDGIQGTVMEVVWPAVVSQSADDKLRRRLGNAKGYVVVFKSSPVD